MKYLTEIWVYPVKSLRGIRVRQWQADERGLRYDRRWMLVDSNGLFISQREFPRLALVDVSLSEQKLGFHSPEGKSLEIPLLPHKQAKRTKIKVWEDECEALCCEDGAGEWFSQYLGVECRLVFMPDDSRREVDPDYAQNAITGFTDAFPFLLIGEASLEDLNKRMERALPMTRFRPNLVVNGTFAFEEDEWREIQIGEINFEVAKPCARCQVTTIDPQSAETGKEPLRTLSQYRKFNNKVLFGQNLVHRQLGMLVEGQELKVKSFR